MGAWELTHFLNFSVETVSALIVFSGCLVALKAYFWKSGRLWFWNVVFAHPDLFFEHMDSDDAWVYSSDDLTKPSDEFTGPFYLRKDGKRNKIFVLTRELNRSENRFIARHPDLFGPKPFPIISSLFLLYPIVAMLSLHHQKVLVVVGYGFTNLAYLLAISGLLSGSFNALGLVYRTQVFFAAIFFFTLGVLLWNT